jgi:hypothetical protein
MSFKWFQLSKVLVGINTFKKQTGTSTKEDLSDVSANTAQQQEQIADSRHDPSTK